MTANPENSDEPGIIPALIVRCKNRRRRPTSAGFPCELEVISDTVCLC